MSGETAPAVRSTYGAGELDCGYSVVDEAAFRSQVDEYLSSLRFLPPEQSVLDKPAVAGSDRSMIRKFSPPSLATPMSPYSHGVSVPAGMRTVTTAGQVGITKDGVIHDA